MQIKILLIIACFCVVANSFGQERQAPSNITATDIVTVINDHAYIIAGVYNLGFFFRGLNFNLIMGILLTAAEGTFIKYLCREISRRSYKHSVRSQNVTQIITVQ
jgi:hypothetical protein